MMHFGSMFRSMLTDRTWLRVGLFSLLAIGILSVSIAFFALSVGQPYMGLSISKGDQGWAIESVDSNGSAGQAGVREGHRPTEINGQPAEEFLERFSENGVVFGMALKELTVVDEQGQLKSVVLGDDSPSWQSVVDQAARLLVVLISWATGFYVLLKRPRSLAASLLCFSSLIFGLLLTSNMAAGIAVPTAFQLQVVATAVGPWLLLHFFLVLPEERTWPHKNLTAYLIYLTPAVTLLLFFLVGYANGQPVQWFRTLRMLEAGAGLLAAVGVAIINYVLAASVRTRQQMKIVLIGCLAAVVPFAALYLIPEAIWRQSALPPELGVLLIAFIPMSMGYAVVTRKLMDIDVVIRRGVIYGLITLAMAAVLSTAIVPLLAFKGSLGPPQEIGIALALGAMATVLFGPTKRGIENLVDRLFYRDRYDYRQIVSTLSTSMDSLSDLTDMARLTVGTAVQSLNLAGGCLFVNTQAGSYAVGAAQGTFADSEKQRQLLAALSPRNNKIEFPNAASTANADIAFVIPLAAGEKEVGILFLSRKVSRQSFSSDDIYLLQGLASVAASAMRSAMLVRDVSVRDTFVSIASHELRSPLTSIMGYADLLLRRNPPDATRKLWLEHIIGNGQRITDLVSDLLNVSRIQSGRISIKLEGVKPCDVLGEQMTIAREYSDNHTFALEVDSEVPDVLVDRDKFGQVIGNLLSNAVKYSPSGGRVTLSARYDSQRHRVVVSVSDQGIGISQTDRDSLFTAFHRIQRPETQGIRGIGLGLYIVKEWTEAMGGEVWLTSVLKKGSTFHVAVPAHGTVAAAKKLHAVRGNQ